MVNPRYTKRGGQFRGGQHRGGHFRGFQSPAIHAHRAHFALNDSASEPGAFFQSFASNIDSDLRHRPIRFVSAGYHYPLDDLKTLQKAQIKTKEKCLPLLPAGKSPDQDNVSTLSPPTSRPNPIQVHFTSVTTELISRPEARDNSPVRSDSSDAEVLVFRGRNNKAKQSESSTFKASPSSNLNASPKIPIKKSTEVTNYQQRSLLSPASLNTKASNTETQSDLDLNSIRLELQSIIDEANPQQSSTLHNENMVKGSQRRAARKESRLRKNVQKHKSGRIFSHGRSINRKSIFIHDKEGHGSESGDDAMYRDYVENITETGENSHSKAWAYRDLGGEEGDVAIFTSDTNVTAVAITNDHPEDEDNEFDLDLEVLKTLDSDLFSIDTKPEPQGPIDIISQPAAYEFGIPDDAVSEDIDAGTSNDYNSDGEHGNADVRDNDDLPESDINDHLEDISGSAGFEDELDDDLPYEYLKEDEFYNQDIIAISPGAFKKSMKRQEKGQSPFFDPNIDTDLQDIMIGFHNSSLARKVAKKQKREQLRTQDLLGKKAERRAANPRNLSVVYPSNMTFDQIKEEVWLFLTDADRAELTFPPMKPFFRKGLHEVAHQLNLTSKSTGAGDSRRLTLYKKITSITDEYTYRQRMAWIGSKHFKIKAVSNRGADMQRKPVPSTRLKEGEVVGGDLPQIGNDNRGHALLKKMGWNHGTALGSVQNKGIMEPVQSVMKKTKAGLQWSELSHIVS